MRFLKHWLDTEWSELTLLDLAYVVVLLPLVLMLKVPMMIFLIIAVSLIAFKRQPASGVMVLSVFILGVVALYLSSYGAFNFSGLSRLKIFLEILVYILLIVVAMQRLTRTINLYLLISPFLFLSLSLFFYHGIVMLIYVVFEVFVLLWLILAHRMEGDIREGFRGGAIMFMYSLPWVVVLFIFFPRISFEHADYGFKGETTKRMGHDGTMYLDGNALLVPSDRIVMEVGFEGEIPDARDLYFRGSILYVDKKDHWEPLPGYLRREKAVEVPFSGKIIRYKVTLYPTQKRWLYLLDMPESTDLKSHKDRDRITTVTKVIDEPLHYAASSSLSDRSPDRLDAVTLKASTAYVVARNPHSFRVAQKIKREYPSLQARAEALVAMFKEQSLTYTLKPDVLDTNHTTDSFLFDKRRGYCVHFASSFVTMARMAGIPARVVTGYKSDRSQSLNHYLAVREKDAHAWAELYLGTHWVRYETTRTATNIDFQSQTLAAAQAGQNVQSPLLKKINLYLLYTKYQIETWILYYSHVRQLQLLDYAKKHPLFVLGFVVSFILLVILSFMISLYLKRPRYGIETLAILQPLLIKLKKEEFVRGDEESMHQFLIRYLEEHPGQITVREIDSLYEKIVYGGESSREVKAALKRAVKSACG